MIVVIGMIMHCKWYGVDRTYWNMFPNDLLRDMSMLNDDAYNITNRAADPNCPHDCRYTVSCKLDNHD